MPFIVEIIRKRVCNSQVCKKVWNFFFFITIYHLSNPGVANLFGLSAEFGLRTQTQIVHSLNHKFCPRFRPRFLTTSYLHIWEMCRLFNNYKFNSPQKELNCKKLQEHFEMEARTKKCWPPLI